MRVRFKDGTPQPVLRQLCDLPPMTKFLNRGYLCMVGSPCGGVKEHAIQNERVIVFNLETGSVWDKPASEMVQVAPLKGPGLPTPVSPVQLCTILPGECFTKDHSTDASLYMRSRPMGVMQIEMTLKKPAKKPKTAAPFIVCTNLEDGTIMRYDADRPVYPVDSQAMWRRRYTNSVQDDCPDFRR
jgi:hypothetical protein